jgi:hypothetical protein
MVEVENIVPVAMHLDLAVHFDIIRLGVLRKASVCNLTYVQPIETHVSLVNYNRSWGHDMLRRGLQGGLISEWLRKEKETETETHRVCREQNVSLGLFSGDCSATCVEGGDESIAVQLGKRKVKDETPARQIMYQMLVE